MPSPTVHHFLEASVTCIRVNSRHFNPRLYALPSLFVFLPSVMSVAMKAEETYALQVC
jgi:hypothetical protein